MAIAFLIGLAGCEAPERPVVPTPSEMLEQEIDPNAVLQLTERVRVGSSDQAAFHRIRGLAKDRDGFIYVLDAGNNRVAVFDRAGSLIREFGSGGDGPGEFRGARSIWVAGDTVAVGDGSNRLHFFGSDGTKLLTRAYRELGENGWLVGRPTRGPGGWLVVASSYFQRNVEGNENRLPPLPRWRVQSVGDDGDLDLTGFRWEQEQEGRWSEGFWVQAPFAPRPAVALDGRGRVHVAGGRDYVIDVYSPNGEPIRRVVNQVPRRPVEGELLELWKESKACDGQPECVERHVDLALSLPIPEFQPVIGEIRGFEGGYTAVRRADLDPDPFDASLLSAYDFFDPDGRYLGRLPAGPSPRWFDGRDLLVVERDSLGVEYVVEYVVDQP